MNLARKTQPISDSDPRSVLRAIGSNAGFDLNQASFESAEEPEQPASSAELMPLRINPDTNPAVVPEPQSFLEATVDSATQIQQLAIRLRQNELELEQREIELEERVKNLDQSALQQQSVYERRRNQIEQQASQVRCQQLHLM